MEQIRFVDYIEQDPIYRAWLKKIPTLTGITHTPPWRLYVQKTQGGRWARGDIDTYPQAYHELQQRLQGCWDITIHCKPQAWEPPLVYKGKNPYYIPMPDGHHWCGLCRRPTLFKHLTKHPTIKYPLNPEELRCMICALRLNPALLFRSPLTWPLKLATKS